MRAARMKKDILCMDAVMEIDQVVDLIRSKLDSIKEKCCDLG